MSDSNTVNIYAAFETLLEEIEAAINDINQAGAQAFADRAYDTARTVLERAGKLTEFRTKVDALRSEWMEIAGPPPEPEIQVPEPPVEVSGVPPEEVGVAPQAPHRRLQRGLRTPERAYYQPILQALAALGGRAKMNDVLDHVEQLLRDTLTEVDYQPLGSSPEMPRWRNAAQWARNAMVKEGLLRDNSPRGVWEISEGGRHILVGR